VVKKSVGGGLKISVVTSLFPSKERPNEGVFCLRRWAGMSKRGHQISVLNPQPYAPWPLGGSYAVIRRRSRQESIAGLNIHRPRYLHIPKFPIANAERFSQRAFECLPEADIVVCDYAWPSAALAPLLSRINMPCVINGRGSDVLEVAGEAGLGAHCLSIFQLLQIGAQSVLI